MVDFGADAISFLQIDTARKLNFSISRK